MHVYFVSHIWIKVMLMKGKLKVVPLDTMKAYRESRGTAPLILNLSTSWHWEVSCMPQPLYPWGKSFQYPWSRRLVALTAGLDFSGRVNLAVCEKSNQSIADSLYWLHCADEMFVDSRKQFGLVVMLWSCIQEVPSSKLCNSEIFVTLCNLSKQLSG
jgi:hypothetical protein